MAEPTSFIYDLGRKIDIERVKKGNAVLKSPPGERNFLYARLDGLNVILFSNGKLRVTHLSGTRESLEKALPAAVPKIQKLVEDIAKAAGIKVDASEVIANGKAEEEGFAVPERTNLGGRAGLLALQAIAIHAPDKVLGEYQRERVAVQAGDTIGRTLARDAKNKDALAKAIVDFLKNEGIGIAEVGGGGDVVFIVRESAFAYGLPPVGKPLCGFIRGLIRGAYAAFFHSESVNVAETRCWGTGDVECEFCVKQLAV
ncbi:MAG: V4R domain-containing protein [Candidatus Micrarchaeia archaeon]